MQSVYCTSFLPRWGTRSGDLLSNTHVCIDRERWLVLQDEDERQMLGVIVHWCACLCVWERECERDGFGPRRTITTASRERPHESKFTLPASPVTKWNCPTAKGKQSLFDDVIHIIQKFWGGRAGWSVGVRAAEAGEGGGRGREEEEEVMSEMAALHNFEMEQKEGEGKWKARKKGVCYLCLRRWGLVFLVFTSRPADTLERSDWKFFFVIHL